MKRNKFHFYDFFPRHKLGKASKVISSFDELTPDDKVFLVERVSGCERKANLKDQDANLRTAVKRVGAKIVGKIAIPISGFYPLWLWYATIEAKKLGATVLLAETTDRFIRHPLFHSVLRPDYQATDEQLAELVEATQGMKLMTHLDPDASPKEVRSYQRKRGQRFKHRKGGRPAPGHMTRRYEEKNGLVLFLRRQGWSYDRIAVKGMVSLPKSTVRNWCKEAGI